MADRTISFAHVLFSFEGRIGRPTFWLRGVLPILVVYFLVALVTAVAAPAAGAVGAGGAEAVIIAGAVMIAVLIWPSLAVGVKRCHDRGRSGWFVLIGLVPIIGAIWLLVDVGFLKGFEGENRFGPDPLQ